MTMPYLLHVSVLLTVCILFYKVLLQKETFFGVNRYLLLAGIILSFCLPLLRVPGQWSLQSKPPAVQTTIPSFTTLPILSSEKEYKQTMAAEKTVPVAEENHFDTARLLTAAVWLYWIGVIAFAINFLIQLILLLYRSYTLPSISDGRYRIVELSGDAAPCSFGNIIFINPEKYDWDTYSQVLAHEKMHIQQGHSYDLLLAELVIVFQWFNPFAWLYRKEIEANLEFFTDNELLERDVVPKDTYQMSLLKVITSHFPMRITTNYNQSLLKKRFVMMNRKKSNVHIIWKYLFLLPLLLFFVCLLNEPRSYSQTTGKNEKTRGEDKDQTHDMSTDGVWFATIKSDTINFQLKDDNNDNSFNGNTFLVSEFSSLPRDKEGSFTLTREAGTITFTGKFEGNKGMGRYRFAANSNYTNAMKQEGVNLRDDGDVMVFFMVNVTQDYVQMLKKNGYTKLDRDDLIPLAALKIDENYILSFKRNGLMNISLQDLIPLKSLGVDEAYIKDIRAAGYPDVDAGQLITFKSQGIDGKYIADIKKAANAKTNRSSTDQSNSADNQNKDDNDNDNINVDDVSANNLVAIKSMDISPAYIQSLRDAGYDNLSSNDIITMKSMGVTADYIKGVQSEGLKDVSVNDLVSMKSQSITADYINGLKKAGYTNISSNDLITLKAMDITPEYIQSFSRVGYKDVALRDAITLKSQNITPALIQQYKDLGFTDISMNDIISAKATGTTPAFVKSMQEKGHKLSSLDKYMQLKMILQE